MKSCTLTVLLTLAVVPVFTVGCSTSRHALTSNDTTSSVVDNENETLAVDDYSNSTEANSESSIITVANTADEDSDEINSDSSVNLVQVVPPVELEDLSLPSEIGSSSGMTLDAIEQLAMDNNPAIQQAIAAAARAGGIRTQVGLKPNPTLGYNGAQLADDRTDQNSLFIEQTFVRGDKLEWNQQVIGHDVNAMNWLVETQRQRLRTDIRLAFYEALAAQKRLELSREFREIATKGVRVSEERVKAGVGTQPDILQSEIQLNEVDLAIQRAEFEYSAAWNELAALVGVPALGRTNLIGDLNTSEVSRDADTEFAHIVAASPLLAAAHARVDRARSNLQRQRVQPIPNVSGHLGFGHDNGTGDEFVNLQLSLPIPIRNKNQGNIRAAYAEYCEATQNVERIRMSLRRDMARVMREYQVADVTVRRYRDSILPKAKASLEVMQEAREAGEFDFLRVLTTRRAYFDVNIEYVTAQQRLAQANSKIDGLLLTGGLADVVSYDEDDSLRGQALSGQ